MVTSTEETIVVAFDALDKIFQKIIFCLKELCPGLEFQYYLNKALQILDYELVNTQQEKTDEKRDKIYRLLFDILESEIKKDYEQVSLGKAWQKVVANSLLKDVVLSQPPCRIFYVFFRLLYLWLRYLQNKMENASKIKMAQAIIEILEVTDVYSEPEAMQRCELQSIFQWCRRNALKKIVMCPCEQEKGDSW